MGPLLLYRPIDRKNRCGWLRSGGQLEYSRLNALRRSLARGRGVDALELAPSRTYRRGSDVGQASRHRTRDLAAVRPHRLADRPAWQRFYIPKPGRQILPSAFCALASERKSSSRRQRERPAEG